MTQMTIHGYEGAGSPDRADALIVAYDGLFPKMTMRKPDISKFEWRSSGRGGFLAS